MQAVNSLLLRMFGFNSNTEICFLYECAVENQSDTGEFYSNLNSSAIQSLKQL
jgi:hypothetical protein